MNTEKKTYCKEYYLIDVSRGEYEELTPLQVKKKLNKSESFINKYANSEELFIVNDRGYYLTKNFGSIWDLI